MLTSFFGKSNPINYLILGILIFVGYVISNLSGSETLFTFPLLIEHLIFIAISVFVMLLLDFIIRKNNLNKNNTFGILIFTCFLLAIPIVFYERSLVISNVFLLFSLRKILSLRTDKNSEKKILDASIWIAIASIVYFWSFLFFAILFFAISKKSNTNYKHFLIPLVGAFGVFLIATAYFFVVNDSFSWFYQWKPSISWNFSKYNYAAILVPSTILISLIIWVSGYRIVKLPSIIKKERPNAVIILFSGAITTLIAITSPIKNGSELLFMLVPASIIIANYIEGVTEFWFKETLLWLVVALPIVILFL